MRDQNFGLLVGEDALDRLGLRWRRRQANPERRVDRKGPPLDGSGQHRREHPNSDLHLPMRLLVGDERADPLLYPPPRELFERNGTEMRIDPLPVREVGWSAASKARAGSTGRGTSWPHAPEPSRALARLREPCPHRRALEPCVDVHLRGFRQRSRCGPSPLLPANSHLVRATAAAFRLSIRGAGARHAVDAMDAGLDRLSPAALSHQAAHSRRARSPNAAAEVPANRGRREESTLIRPAILALREDARQRPSMYLVAARRLRRPSTSRARAVPGRAAASVPGVHAAASPRISWALRAAAPPTARERRGGRRDARQPGSRRPVERCSWRPGSRGGDIAPARAPQSRAPAAVSECSRDRGGTMGSPRAVRNMLYSTGASAV